MESANETQVSVSTAAVPAELRHVSLLDLASDYSRISGDDENRDAARAEYAKERSIWESINGKIAEEFFGAALLWCGVVLTESGDLHLLYRAGEVGDVDPRFAEILNRAEFIESQARVLLTIPTISKSPAQTSPSSRTRRALVGTQLYAVTRYVLGVLDYVYWLTGQANEAEARIVEIVENAGLDDSWMESDVGSARGTAEADRASTPEDEKSRQATEEAIRKARAEQTTERRSLERAAKLCDAATSVASERLNEAEASLWREARARATQRYLVGVALSLVSMFFLSLLVWLGVRQTSLDPTVGLAIGAGGVGAAISVLSRLVTASLQVDAAAGRATLLVAGASRVIIGAIFGSVIFVFGSSGLVSLPHGNDAAESATYLWLALGFLAGFSERWVRDLIGTVETPDHNSGNSPAARS